MNTITKLATLALIIVGLSACGKMGELEPVKAEAIAAVDSMVHYG